MSYVVISCEPRDGSARRIYVKHYQVDQVHSEVLEQSLREARELCRARECERAIAAISRCSGRRPAASSIRSFSASVGSCHDSSSSAFGSAGTRRWG
jgi:hypothetical protein